MSHSAHNCMPSQAATSRERTTRSLADTHGSEPPEQACLARRRRTSLRGFSLIEVMFAIGMLAIGIVGVLSLFTTGIQAAAWSNNMTSASMEAQSLYTRVVAEVDPVGKRIFLCRINDPNNPISKDPANEWIQTDGNQQDPVQTVTDGQWWWQCRVTKYAMDPESPMDKTQDAKTNPFPTGLYEIAIAVYRNWSPSHKKPPIVVFTTFVTAGY